MLQAYNPNIDYTKYKAISKNFNNIDENTYSLVSRCGWNKNEFWWLIQILESLSGKQLSKLYKYLDPEDWLRQEKRWLFKKFGRPTSYFQSLQFYYLSFRGD